MCDFSFFLCAACTLSYEVPFPESVSWHFFPVHADSRFSFFFFGLRIRSGKLQVAAGMMADRKQMQLALV